MSRSRHLRDNFSVLEAKLSMANTLILPFILTDERIQSAGSADYTPEVPAENKDVPDEFAYDEPTEYDPLLDIPPEDIPWTKEWIDKWREILRIQFRDFSSVTTVHGVLYIGEEGRHWTER